jgi:hypothetical protein
MASSLQTSTTTDLPEGIPGASDAVWTFPENDEMVVCVRVLGCQIYAVLLAREPSVIAQFPTFPCRIQNEFQFFVDIYSSLYLEETNSFLSPRNAFFFTVDAV